MNSETRSMTREKISILSLVLLVFILFSGSSAHGATLYYYVSESTGSNLTGNGSIGSPWASIGHALGKVDGTSVDPVVIYVAEGNYPEAVLMEDWTEIRGGYNTTFTQNDPLEFITVLDGTGNYHTVVGADNAQLDGFYITGGNANGTGDNEYGGGILCDARSPIISHCVVAANSADKRGGGLFARASSLTVIDNIFVLNTTAAGGYGGAVFLDSMSGQTPVIEDNLFVDNAAYLSFAVSQSHGSVSINRNRFCANQSLSGAADSGTCLSTLYASGELVNNEFIGNSGQFVQIGNALSYGTVYVTNNTLVGSPTTALYTYNSLVYAINSIFSSSETALRDDDDDGDVIPRYSLLFNNSRDLLNEDTFDVNGANTINLTIPGAEFNVEGNPLFGSGHSATWTDNAFFDSNKSKTQLVDKNGITGGIADGLVGWYVNPDTSQHLFFPVISSSGTDLIVWGDASSLGLAGASYTLVDLHLNDTSQALDRGTTIGSSIPSDDREGDTRPGSDNRIDIGADEAPSAYQPVPDATPPLSYVADLAPLNVSLTFDVPFMASDDESGFNYVLLYYRQGTTGPFSQFGGGFTTSPISFTAAGDGVYQFYTRAVDNNMNTEAIPGSADDETRVLTSFTGSVVHVDTDAMGSDTGENWIDAVPTIKQGLLIAQGFSIPQVWVAEGSYNETVTLVDGTELFGGFRGSEILISQRAPSVYRTVIDGTGLFHCVIGEDNATIDGFVIWGAYANGSGDDLNGAGIFCDGTSPLIQNNVISGNRSVGDGAGLYARNSSVQIINNRFVQNDALGGSYGGAVYIDGSYSETILITDNSFISNRAYLGSAIRISSLLFDIRRNCFAGNFYLTGDPTGGVVLTTLYSYGALVNNEFIGNSGQQVQIGNGIAYGPVSFVNNTLKGSETTALNVYNTSVSAVNNLFFENATAIEESDVAGDVTPLYNLFTDNVIDFIDEDSYIYSGVSDINLQVPGAMANITGAPNLVTGASYTWTDPSLYDSGLNTTMMTDSLSIPGGAGGGLTGWYINPDTTQNRVFSIINSSSTTVTVYGDASGIAGAGDTYRVESLWLGNLSGALDRGSLSEPDVPSIDRQGEVRPGSDGLIDIGSDEAPPSYTPRHDMTAPLSEVTTLAAIQSSLLFNVSWVGSDSESGVAYVQLFYRPGRSGPFLPFGGIYTTSPVPFNAPADGVYQFYTIATDNDGNIEAAPGSPDAETRVLTQFSGSVVYVDTTATGNESGVDWANAVTLPSQGLLIADAFDIPEVWVAEGTYTDSFTLIENSTLYGGFIGMETLLDQRDPASNVTVIDGAGSDHVIIGQDNAGLDGFTITGGNADGPGELQYGGGLYCNGTSPMISNNVFRGNLADIRGGAIYADDSSLQIVDNVFVDNTVGVGQSGGAIYLAGSSSDTPRIEGNLFTNNNGTSGQAIRISNVVIDIVGNRFLGNYDVEGNSTAGNTLMTLYSRGRIVNNDFIGNSGLQVQIGNAISYGQVHFVNNSFLGSPDAALRTYSSEVNAVNTIFSSGATAMWELDTNGDIFPVNNLFFGNTTDFIDENSSSYTGAASVNGSVSGASGNMDGNPMYETGPAGIWAADGSYNSSTGKTTFTSTTAITGGSNDGLRGHYLNPDTSQNRVFYITESSNITVSVWGDCAAIGSGSDAYLVQTLRLGSGSAAFDVADTGAVEVPDEDIDGDRRPGVDGLIDVGSDEVGYWIFAGADITVVAGEVVLFDATYSGGTPPYSFTWEWMDGSPNGSGENTSHVFDTSAVYDVLLTVEDNTKLVTTDTRTVTVIPREISPPVSSYPLRIEKNGGGIRVFWESSDDPGVQYNVYRGNLNDIHGGYSYDSVICFTAGIAGTGSNTGWHYYDLATPSGVQYFLITGSSDVEEGTAGSSSGTTDRDTTSGSRCGPIP